MRPLEDATIGQRVVTTFIIVLIVILILALIGWLSGGWNEGPEGYGMASADDLMASPYDDRIIMLDREAADNAYRAQISHLFSIWMKDDSGQPARAIKGANQARKAYIDVQKAVDKRETDLRKLRTLNQ
jgi:hypothetical protein